jgi:hypothetical protein
MRPVTLRTTATDAGPLKNRETRRPLTTFFATQGNQGSRKCCRENHYTPEKYRMECVWKNLLRYRVRRLPENIRSLELAKGFEPPTL